MKNPVLLGLPRPVRSAGFSLIELLVAMAMTVGLLTIVLSAYQGMFSGNRLGEAQQQLNEDAQAAFQLLAPHIRAAGYNPPQPRAEQPPQNSLSFPLPAVAPNLDLGIFGCDNGFANGSGAAPAAQMAGLVCNAAGAAGANGSSFAVLYEADGLSPQRVGGQGADCRGFAVPIQAQALVAAAPPNPPPAPYQVVENRYFISPDANGIRGGLSCTGNGGATAFDTPTQPLVANIESMQITYGVANPNVPNPPFTFVAGYLTADQIGAAAGLPGATVDPGLSGLFGVAPAVPAQLTGSQRWALVNTVRVCVVVRSDAAVLTDVLAPGPNGTNIFGYYAGCNPVDATQIPITDRFLRKSFVMHFAIRARNR
jgi:type IV pilus assembly protein PilW